MPGADERITRSDTSFKVAPTGQRAASFTRRALQTTVPLCSRENIGRLTNAAEGAEVMKRLSPAFLLMAALVFTHTPWLRVTA